MYLSLENIIIIIIMTKMSILEFLINNNDTGNLSISDTESYISSTESCKNICFPNKPTKIHIPETSKMNRKLRECEI